MNAYTFQVAGSGAEPYTVTLAREGQNLTAKCTCMAGKKGMMCKHRLALLSGDSSGVVSSNAAEVAHVAGWLIGSDVEEAMALLKENETRRNFAQAAAKSGLPGGDEEAESASELVKRCRAVLARALGD